MVYTMIFGSAGKIVNVFFVSSAALICTGPLVTQSASTIYDITRLALVSMRQMLEGIV